MQNNQRGIIQLANWVFLIKVGKGPSLEYIIKDIVTVNKPIQDLRQDVPQIKSAIRKIAKEQKKIYIRLVKDKVTNLPYVHDVRYTATTGKKAKLE